MFCRSSTTSQTARHRTLQHALLRVVIAISFSLTWLLHRIILRLFDRVVHRNGVIFCVVASRLCNILFDIKQRSVDARETRAFTFLRRRRRVARLEVVFVGVVAVEPQRWPIDGRVGVAHLAAAGGSGSRVRIVVAVAVLLGLLHLRRRRRLLLAFRVAARRACNHATSANHNQPTTPL